MADMRECAKLEGFLLFFLFIKVFFKKETDEGFCCLLICVKMVVHTYFVLFMKEVID